MSDFKSKLPDMKELGEITGKLFKDIKTSVTEIMGTYKQKRAQTQDAAAPKVEPADKNTVVEPVKVETVEVVEIKVDAPKEPEAAKKVETPEESADKKVE